MGGGVCPNGRGCLPKGEGVSAQGGVSPEGSGVSALGVCIPACNGADTSPPCEQNDWQTGVKTLSYPKLRLRTVKMNNSMGYFLDFQIQMELNARVTWPFSATHSQVLLVWSLSTTCLFTCRQTIGSTFWIIWFVQSLLKLPAGHLHKSEYFHFHFCDHSWTTLLAAFKRVFPKCPQWILRKCFYIYIIFKKDYSRIFKSTPMHVSVIYQIHRIHWISVPFRENSMMPLDGRRDEINQTLISPNVRTTLMNTNIRECL